MKSFQIGDLIIPVPIVQGGMGIGISLSELAFSRENAHLINSITTVDEVFHRLIVEFKNDLKSVNI